MRTLGLRFSSVFLFLNSFVYYTQGTLFEMYSSSVTLKETEKISSSKVLSRMKCAHDCNDVPGCNSFNYNDDQHVCQLSETKLKLHSSRLSDPTTFKTDGFTVFTRGIKLPSLFFN